MVLNEQLSNMYQPYFNELIAHLKSDGLVDKVQPPFLLGLNREKEGKEKGNHKAYCGIMFKSYTVVCQSK